MKTAGLVCQLTCGHSAGCWVGSREAAAALLGAEAIFAVTAVQLGVTLWQQPFKWRDDLYCSRAEAVITPFIKEPNESC